MAHNERNIDARFETAPGSLERMTRSPENDGEKSLLTLIEEHSARESQQGASENHDSPGIVAFDDIDEEDRPRFDQQTLRLGGNGF